MLLKRCAFFLMLSHKIILCGTDVKSGVKKNTILTTENNTILFNRSSREFKKRTSLDMANYPSKNKVVRRSLKGRWLEDYMVVTSDKYILTIFRLTYENNEPPAKKCPVLLVHDIFQSSDKYLEQVAEQSLALKLQDVGYDVWLANFRGNKHGRLHAKLDSETNDRIIFFDYTYEELGLYDIASIVDFILNITTFDKLLYIGHSLGGTAFLVLNSLKPEYNHKFEMAYLMAPIGYQRYFPHDNLKAQVRRLDELYEELLKEGAVEIFPYTDNYTKFSAEDCLGNKLYKHICDEINIQKCMGLKYVNNDISDTRGGSLKQLAHLAQNVRSKSFSRWDYGSSVNKEQYGSRRPPKYNLGLITVPTNVIYAPNDELVSADDIADMVKDMANAKSTKVPREDFRHQDFIFATDVMETVYAGIIKDLEENPKKCVNGIGNDTNDGSFKHLRCFSIPFLIVLFVILALIWFRQIHIDDNICSVEPYLT